MSGEGSAVENERTRWLILVDDTNEHLRWVAVVSYRSDRGPIEVDHHFEELCELDALIERGPDWNTIIQITIRLNPRRVFARFRQQGWRHLRAWRVSRPSLARTSP